MVRCADTSHHANMVYSAVRVCCVAPRIRNTMPTNPYFNQISFATEQSLVNDLIVETIQIYGHSAYYLRREDVNIDPLFYEDPLARYPNASEIEIYLKSNISFAGSSEVFSKFGLVIEDQATFLVAVSRFATVEPTLNRPRENDIIYIQFTPMNRYLFEIRFVENKEQLFQLGKLYTFELRCEMMNYSNERIETGDTDIDGVATAAETLDQALAVDAAPVPLDPVSDNTLLANTAPYVVVTRDNPRYK